ELGFDFLYQAVSDKRKALSELMVQSGIGREKMGYMGDDIVDLPVMMAVAFRAAPISAHEDVVSRADWVSKRPAGEGAVRELCDYLLKAR
ncbi:HAD family hydrolase, partial [Acinetobacter baumannii]